MLTPLAAEREFINNPYAFMSPISTSIFRRYKGVDPSPYDSVIALKHTQAHLGADSKMKVAVVRGVRGAKYGGLSTGS